MLGGTTSHLALQNLGQENLSNPPGRYPAPIPTGSPYQNHSPGLRTSVLSEAGPSRSPVHPTTRHQPYPQSRPQRQGPYTKNPPIYDYEQPPSPTHSTHGHQGSMVGYHTWGTQPYQTQPQGFCGPAMSLPTPPIEAGSLLERSSRLLPRNQPERLPPQAKQNRGRRPPNSPSASLCQVRPHKSPEMVDVQSMSQPFVVCMGPPQSPKCAQVQKSPEYPIGESRGTDQDTTPVLVTQSLCQRPAPIQGRDPDECHQTEATNQEDDISRDRDAQDPFSHVSWEGWGFIETPDGVYLPETFNPSPFGLEDFSDRW